MSEMSAAPLWQPPSLRVVNPAADKLTFEQELERARQQGYQEGLRQGLDAGRQQARNTLAEMSALWDAMQQPFADMEHAVHSELTGLVVAIAEAVLHRELKTDKALITDALDRALSALAGSDGIVDVRVNPRDADLLTSLLDDNEIESRIKPDPNMMPGGCKLHRGHAFVDASIEAMIAEVVAAIADETRMTDAAGNETARALDPEELQTIAARFARPESAGGNAQPAVEADNPVDEGANTAADASTGQVPEHTQVDRTERGEHD